MTKRQETFTDVTLLQEKHLTIRLFTDSMDMVM